MAVTAYSYMDKEARRKLKAMPLMTAGVFNRHFKSYREKIELSLADEQEADNLRSLFSYYFFDRITMMGDIMGVKTGWRRRSCSHNDHGVATTTYLTPFGEDLVNDYVALLQLAVRAISKEKKKTEIKAAAEGKVAYEDLKRKFPMISKETLGHSKIKIQLCRDLDEDGHAIPEPVKKHIYIWHHYEVIEKKDWYSVEEITACIKKIVDHMMDLHMEHIRKLDRANAVLEKLRNIELNG